MNLSYNTRVTHIHSTNVRRSRISPALIRRLYAFINRFHHHDVYIPHIRVIKKNPNADAWTHSSAQAKHTDIADFPLTGHSFYYYYYYLLVVVAAVASVTTMRRSVCVLSFFACWHSFRRIERADFESVVYCTRITLMVRRMAYSSDTTYPHFFRSKDMNDCMSRNNPYAVCVLCCFACVYAILFIGYSPCNTCMFGHYTNNFTYTIATRSETNTFTQSYS